MADYTDDDLADFFASPDARKAALDARRPDAPRTPAGGDGEDAELATFFGSPDAPPVRPATRRTGGDGADRDVRVAPPPGQPSAPPPATGPEALRRRRVARALAVVLAVIGLGVVAGLAVIGYLSRDLPSFEQIEDTENLLATQVLTADGVELARYYDGENRTWVSLAEMSDFVPRALIATEDHRFYQHWGVDGYAIGAIIKDVLTGQGARGGSTITMQLSRNLYREATGFVTGERSVVRKAKEILIAVRLERTYTKPEILEAYLNTVPFLYNAYGIEAASQTFYSKPAADLNANEAATLIGMLAANSRYNPCRAEGGNSAECRGPDPDPTDGEPGPVLTESQNPDAIARRNTVLMNMRNRGVLSEDAYRETVESPIRLAFDVYSHEDNIAPHFAEVLRMWFVDWADANDNGTVDEGELDPYEDGLVIHTTIDSRMQEVAQRAVEEQMNQLQQRVERAFGTNASLERWLLLSKNEVIRNNAQARAAVDAYIAQTDRYTQTTGTVWSGRRDDLDAGVIADLRDNEAFMDSLKTARTRLEAGLVAMDPTDGRVRAWVGGRNFVVNKYDHAGQARRQPGSTFKLFAYATAFNNGYAPSSGVWDSPFRWGSWAPQNSGGGYAGYVTLTDALRASRNTVAARITKHFGTAEVARTAYQFGIRTPLELAEFDAETCPPFEARKNDCYPQSIALGTQDVSVLEMVAAYATVANYGVYHGPTVEQERPRDASVPPHIVLAIDRIEDRYGNVIEDFSPVGREVINPSTAYTTFDAMRGVVTGGTGRGLGSRFPATRALDVAGKTGTTQGNGDGWFIAMTPQLVVGSWTGFDDRRLTYPNTAIGQGGRTGLQNVGAFFQLLQTEAPEDVRLDPEVELDRPEDFQPPTRRSRIGDAGYWPGSSRGRSRRASRSNDRNNRSADRPARDMIDRFRQRDRAQPAPRPQTQGGGSGGRIGW